MDALLANLQKLDYLTALWLFPIAVAVHELEEWNIVRWYERNFVDLPALTDKGARAWILFTCVLGFIWTTLAIVPGSASIAGFVLLLAFALMLQNGLQHVFYLVYFKSYAPGVVTSLLLLFPIIGYLALTAVQHNYVPGWYLLLLALLVIPNLIQTVRARNTMMSSFRAVHRFGATLARYF